MGLLQETSACIKSAKEAKFIEEILLKAIETKNEDIINFCKENLYSKYLEDIEYAEEFAGVTDSIVKMFEEDK